MTPLYAILPAWWLLGGCAGPPPEAGESLPTNVLVLLADDLGTEMLRAYGAHPDQPPTPTIDALAAAGIRFDNAYASAVCSPSRAMLQTGRLPRRTRVGDSIHMLDDRFELSLDEVTIPEMLAHAELRWQTALVGKWHLASFDSPNVPGNPGLQGYDHHAGAIGNLSFSYTDRAKTDDYYHWESDVDGAVVRVDDYEPTALVDHALAHIAAQESPWFTVVAINSPHAPFHVPPPHLHDYDVTEAGDDATKFRAMVQALDTEIGRLLAGIDPEVLASTLVVFLSDNGSRTEVILPPFDPVRAKGTMYDGGVRVPFLVSGPPVRARGATSDALVNIVDVFPTMAEIARVDVGTLTDAAGGPLVLDGVSLLPWLRDPAAPSGRTHLFTERFEENGLPPYHLDETMVRDDRWKLIHREGGDDELFDTSASELDEGQDLLTGPLDTAQSTALADLEAELDRILAEQGG